MDFQPSVQGEAVKVGSGWSLPSLTDLNMGEEGTHHFGQQTRVFFQDCVFYPYKYLSSQIFILAYTNYDNIDISIAQLQGDTVQ